MLKEYVKAHLSNLKEFEGMLPNVREIDVKRTFSKGLISEYKSFPVYAEVIKEIDGIFLYDIITGKELFKARQGKNGAEQINIELGYYGKSNPNKAVICYDFYGKVDKNEILKDLKLLTEEDIIRYCDEMKNLMYLTRSKTDEYYEEKLLENEKLKSIDELLEKTIKNIKRVRQNQGTK